MERRTKARYFSVRFSPEALMRIDQARLQVYGSRCTLAEAIRRLVEDRLDQLTGSQRPELTRDQSGFHQAIKPVDGTGLSRAEHLQRLAGVLRLAAAEVSRSAVDLKAIVDQEVILLAGITHDLASLPSAATPPLPPGADNS
jgi:hypothetical protein